MIDLDSIDVKAAGVLDGFLVRKDLVRTFSSNFPFRPTLSSLCWAVLRGVPIRKKSTKALRSWDDS